MGQHRFAVILFMGSLFLAGCADSPEVRQDKAEAVTAALSWLALVDEGKYAESWEEASAYLRSAVAQGDHVRAMQAVRAPLGALVEREVKKTRLATSLPGAPDGRYVLIQTRASFANKTEAVETITPMADSNGTWRVSGYYVR